MLELDPIGQLVLEAPVVVAEHGVDRGQLAERRQQLPTGDVAGVQDHVGLGRRVEHPGVEGAVDAVGEVGVGQDQDPHLASLAAGGAGPCGTRRRRPGLRTRVRCCSMGVATSAVTIEEGSRPMSDRTTASTTDAPATGDDPSAVKDPEEWVTGDEAMTGAQASYLETLSREAGEELDPNLTKAEASERIDALQQETGRGA